MHPLLLCMKRRYNSNLCLNKSKRAISVTKLKKKQKILSVRKHYVSGTELFLSGAYNNGMSYNGWHIKFDKIWQLDALR